MQLVDRFQQRFRVFTHQLLFHLIANFRQKRDQHLQHFAGQIGFTRRLAQRELPVKGGVLVNADFNRLAGNRVRPANVTRLIA